jgi:pimeloyl-ACP methyl ester carboxylesterase
MRIDVNGIGLEVADSGEGPPVLLVHGWPDTHDLWREQVAVLNAAGFRAIAPDLRGFGGSDKPADVEACGIPQHVGDLMGVLDHLGLDRAHVVGHDWGGAIAAVLAALVPDRVASVTLLSVGHPAAFAAAGLPQREKSWYMLLFQFAGVAETWLSDDDFANMRDWSHHPHMDEVRARLRDPAALTASLAIYRAVLPAEVLVAPPVALPPIPVPTMGIWSSGDMALTEAAMTGTAAHVTGPWRYERIEGVGHWIPLEAPDRLNELLLDFLSRTAAPA